MYKIGILVIPFIEWKVVNLVTERNGSQQYFNHPLLKKDGIELRLYQLSEAVKNKNALVILPTALGKTVIPSQKCNI
jgi:superfamily II DNA or RNA helicase